WACTGDPASKPATIARPQPILRIEASAARVRAGNLAERLGTADFNNVHFAEGIGTVAIYRPPFFGAKYIPRHQGELLAGDADQDRLRDPQRQTALLDYRTRQVEIENPVRGQAGAPAGRQRPRESLREATEQGSPAGPSGAPPGRRATDSFRLHGKCGRLAAIRSKRRPATGRHI